MGDTGVWVITWDVPSEGSAVEQWVVGVALHDEGNARQAALSHSRDHVDVRPNVYALTEWVPGKTLPRQRVVIRVHDGQIVDD